MSKLENNQIIGELKFKTNKLNYEVLNTTVYQNLSSAETEDVDASDFPIIHQTNGTILFKLYCNCLIINNVYYFNF